MSGDLFDRERVCRECYIRVCIGRQRRASKFLHRRPLKHFWQARALVSAHMRMQSDMGSFKAGVIEWVRYK